MEDQNPFAPMVDAIADAVLDRLLPRLIAKIEAKLAVQPRWLSIESAGAYIDKTVPGMRHTLKAHLRELPVTMFGGTPRIDREDIDRLGLNLKGR